MQWLGYGQDGWLPLGEWDIPLLQIVSTSSGAAQPAHDWIYVAASFGRSSRDVKLITHVHAVSSFSIKGSIPPLPDPPSRIAQGVFLYPMT